MLNLKRGKRVFAVLLVAAMLFAATFAVIGLSDSEKSKGEMLLGVIDTSKLSVEEFVDTTVIYENEDIFKELEITQNDISSIILKGKIDPVEFANVVGGDVGVRIGEDDVMSHVMEIVFEDDGTFELVIVLNPVFCSEYDNKIPVIVSYTKIDDPANVYELSSVLGVITYNSSSGALCYPAGAEYIDANGEPKALTSKFVPADALRDEDGKVTVMYQDSVVTFTPNNAVVADAPTGDLGSIKDIDGNKVVLSVVKGLEYGYIEVSGSITNDYGTEFNWVVAEGDTVEFTGLKSDVMYTYWVRTPASDGVLASAPVLVAKSETLNAVDSAAKNAFLEKYAEVVVLGTELYSVEDPEVTADKSDTLQLLSLYNGLSDEVKALEIVDEKATYLVISNYLAKHQDIMEVAYVAKAYADLRTDFDYNDMLKAIDDFDDVINELVDLHGDETETFNYILKLTVSYFKINVLLPVDVNDVNKDAKYEAVAYIADTAKTNIGNIYPEELNEFAYVLSNNLGIAVQEYEYVLFTKVNESELQKESRTIESLEDLLDQLAEVTVYTYDGEMLSNMMYDILNTELCELYAADIEDMMTKFEDNEDVLYIYESALEMIKDIYDNGIDDPEVIYGQYPSTKAVYDTVVAFDKAINRYYDAVAELEALKKGRADEVVDIIDSYIYNIDGFVEDIFDLVDNSNAAAAAENVIAGIDAEVAEAKAHLAFIDKKAAAKAEIEALKDNNQVVIDVVNKYHPELDIIDFDYANIDEINANIDAVVAAAKAETEFEKKRAEVISALNADVVVRKSSGRHSASQLAQLDSYLAEALVLIDNLDYAAGKTVSDLEAQKSAALAKFASVKVITVSAGNVPYSGDLSGVDYPADYSVDNGLWGNITNMNGFASHLTMSVKKLTFEGKYKADKIIVATGELTKEEAIAAAKDKVVVLKLDITLNDGATAVSGDNNGLYTVKVLIPADLRDVEGLYVISQDGETTYVYETTREGNYLVFKVAHFSEFLVVADKTVNLTWLIVLLAVLLAVEVGVVVFFVIKRKKKGAAAASIIPFLALLYVPAGVIPMTIFLGVCTVIGAAAATTTAVTYKKKA